MSAGVHPDPGGQLGRHIQHHLPVRGQPLRQRPARAMTSIHRPAPQRPPGGKRRQLVIALALFANRAESIRVLLTGPSTAAVLLALCGSTAIITSSFKGGSSWPSEISTGEEGNATYGSADLS